MRRVLLESASQRWRQQLFLSIIGDVDVNKNTDACKGLRPITSASTGSTNEIGGSLITAAVVPMCLRHPREPPSIKACRVRCRASDLSHELKMPFSPTVYPAREAIVVVRAGWAGSIQSVCTAHRIAVAVTLRMPWSRRRRVFSYRASLVRMRLEDSSGLCLVDPWPIDGLCVWALTTVI